MFSNNNDVGFEREIIEIYKLLKYLRFDIAKPLSFLKMLCHA